MTYRQTASEAISEYNAKVASNAAFKQSLNERIDNYLDTYVPLSFAYCDAHGVDTAEPEDVFAWAGVSFMDAPTADDYLFVSLMVH